MVLLRTAPGISRIHASRRVFDILKKHDIQVPVIHHQWCVPVAGCTSVTDPQCTLHNRQHVPADARWLHKPLNCLQRCHSCDL